MVEEISRDHSKLECKGLAHTDSKYNTAVKFSQDNLGTLDIAPLALDEYECAYIVDDIIKMSEERSQYTTRAKILKVYDPKELRSSEKEFVCGAKAKVSRGGDTTLELWIEEDQDGDRFIGYRRVE